MEHSLVLSPRRLTGSSLWQDFSARFKYFLTVIQEPYRQVPESSLILEKRLPGRLRGKRRGTPREHWDHRRADEA